MLMHESKSCIEFGDIRENFMRIKPPPGTSLINQRIHIQEFLLNDRICITLTLNEDFRYSFLNLEDTRLLHKKLGEFLGENKEDEQK